MALDRTWYNTLVDSDGTPGTGTIWDKAAVDALMDAIDALIGTLTVTGAAHVFSAAAMSVTIRQTGVDVTGPFLTLDSSMATSADYMGGVVFRLANSTNVGKIAGKEFTTDKYGFGFLTFGISGTLTEKMRLTGDGALTVTGPFGDPATTGSAENGTARFSQAAGVGGVDVGFGDPFGWIQARSSANYATNFALHLNPNGGNVGIGNGIVAPAALLHVVGGGVVVGSPTGGDKGTGTINATGIFDDNVLLTDWVFDLHYDGKTTAQIPKGGRLYSLKQTRTSTVRHRRLPWMPTRTVFERERALGKMVTRLWFGQEQQQIYIDQLEARIAAMETA